MMKRKQLKEKDESREIRNTDGVNVELKEAEAEVEAKRGDRRKEFIFNKIDPVIVESFFMTFVAEWGDRSQLATIGLATTTGVTGVTLGGFAGHAICSGMK